MSPERRRYFRIDDTVKLSYQVTRHAGSDAPTTDETFDLIAEQDRRMEVLIAELKHEYPDIIELISLLNLKFERLAHIEKSQKGTLTFRAREVNISACGLAFSEAEYIGVGSQLKLFLMLAEEKMQIDGLVIDCSKRDDGIYVWRVDFLSLGAQEQEKLIQHIVQRQRSQLAKRPD